jgi:hypothetical protein
VARLGFRTWILPQESSMKRNSVDSDTLTMWIIGHGPICPNSICFVHTLTLSFLNYPARSLSCMYIICSLPHAATPHLSP